MVQKLQDEKRILFSPATFNRYLRKYMDDQPSLPDEDYFGEITEGRVAEVESDSVCTNLNKTEHASISFVGNGMED